MGISKYGNELKSYCIDNGLVEFVRNKTKEIYKNENANELLEWFCYIKSHKELDCSNRLLESKYRKYVRARKHIERIINMGNAVFLTITFDNETLNNTSADTRRKYVARFLKSQCQYYVANIDYSPNKQREHYHAVVSSRVDKNAWKYGFTFCELIHVSEFSSKKVSHYITKLTSHAFKVNCSRLLYSREILQ